MDNSFLLMALVALPGLAFLLLSLLWMLGIPVPERVVVKLTSFTLLAATLCTAWLDFVPGALATPDFVWFSVGEYQFSLHLVLDSLSLPFVALTVILTGLIGAFSARYLHRDPGFLRFFLLLHLFAFGSLLLFTAGSLDLLVGGWELVGITSVFLIAFFQQRPSPVSNGLRVFGMYRAADIGLLVGVVLLHHFTGTAAFREIFTGSWPLQSSALTSSGATTVALLLLLAASGKSAQGPFSSWLPRAMEGPTPSSAIFYGAISVHAGVYLLLRAYPLISQSRVAMIAIATLGVISAFMGTLVGRTCADVKNALAYASLSQVGLIFLEIGLGFPTVALWHASGHAIVRTLEFLRAPSALHEYHQMMAAAGGHLERTGLYFEALLPHGLRVWLYRLAADRGHLDSLIDRGFLAPLRAAALLLVNAESKLTQPLPPQARSPRTVRLAPRTAPGEIDA